MDFTKVLPVLQKMHILIVLLTFIVSTQQQVNDPAYMQKWNSYKEECAKEIGVDLAAINKAWDANQFPNDDKFKCYYKCVNTKLGVLDATGDVVDDALREAAAQLNNADTKNEIVEECGPIKGADLCETAYKLMACVKAAKLD